MGELVPTWELLADPRVKELLSLVGRALCNEEDLLGDEEGLDAALENCLLGLAPEYVPPFTDEDHDPDDWALWRELVGLPHRDTEGER